MPVSPPYASDTSLKFSPPSIPTGLINSGVKDYAGLVDQVSRCLRPGGLAIFVESDFRMWSEDKRILIPPNFYTPLPTQGRSSLGSGSSGSSGLKAGRVPTVLTSWAAPIWMATLSKCVRAKGGNIDSAMVSFLAYHCVRGSDRKTMD